MPTIETRKGETLSDVAKRVYTVRDATGELCEQRVRRAETALEKANPRFRAEPSVEAPTLEYLPFHRHFVDSPRRLHPAVHRELDRLGSDRRLMALSFVDPLRLAVDELGVSFTPAVAREVRRLLGRAVSFDAKDYEAVRDGRSLGGAGTPSWTHSSEED